jgi:hypothetical protein
MTSNTMYVIVDSENNVVAASAQAVVRKNGLSAAMLPGVNQKLYRMNNVPEVVLNIRNGREFHSSINKLFAEKFANHNRGGKIELEEIDTRDREKYRLDLKASAENK